MRTWILGSFLALTLVFCLPAVAAETSPFGWSSFDPVGWVIDLFDALWVESSTPADEPSTEELGPGFDPWGLQADEPSTEEMGPGYDPWGLQSDEPSTEEMGPGFDPGGLQADEPSPEELGPGYDPKG